jgi:mannitol-1-/sugar-/sorbitol-6-phosphatase
MTRILCSALLFDMDGVLVDSTAAVARAWTKWAIQQGMDPEYVIKAAHGRTSFASVQAILPQASDAVHRRENALLEQAELSDVADIVALPGARELLTTIPAGQFAVVTSAIRELAEVRLRAAGLLELTRHLVSASDIQRSKPDPEPYLKGAASLGFSPAQCIVIEDAPSGVRSGKDAGCRVMAIRTTTHDSELLAEGADWVVNDCASIRLAASPLPGQLALELADDSRNPRVPQMS